MRKLTIDEVFEKNVKMVKARNACRTLGKRLSEAGVDGSDISSLMTDLCDYVYTSQAVAVNACLRHFDRDSLDQGEALAFHRLLKRIK